MIQYSKQQLIVVGTIFGFMACQPHGDIYSLLLIVLGFIITFISAIYSIYIFVTKKLSLGRLIPIIIGYIVISVSFFFSNNIIGLSTVANNGYGYLSAFEILYRFILIAICYLLIRYYINKSDEYKGDKEVIRANTIIFQSFSFVYLIFHIFNLTLLYLHR